MNSGNRSIAMPTPPPPISVPRASAPPSTGTGRRRRARAASKSISSTSRPAPASMAWSCAAGQQTHVRLRRRCGGQRHPRRHHRFRTRSPTAEGTTGFDRQVHRHQQLQRRPVGGETAAGSAGQRRQDVSSAGSAALRRRLRKHRAARQGFLDYIEEQNKSITLLSTDQYAGATVNEAEKNASPLLLRYKDQFDGLFAVNESSSVGTLNALRSQGLNGKVRFVTFDASEPILQAIREGDINGTVVQYPDRMGYLAVWMLVKHLEGYDVSAGGKDLGTGEYVVTKDNLDAEAHASCSISALQAKRTLKTPDVKKK